jgi:hypothetical protein
MIKYILTHPIQYQSPLIKFLNKKININVAYRSNISLTKFYDKDFNKKIMLKNNLLNGYKYVFLKYLGSNRVTNYKPFTTEFIRNIFLNNSKIIWLHGITIWYNLIIIFLAKLFKKKVFVRCEINHLNNKNLIKLFFKKIFYKFIDNFIDCYLSIGSENKKAYIEYGINPKKIFSVPYVVDNSFFLSKKRRNKKSLKSCLLESLYIGKVAIYF